MMYWAVICTDNKTPEEVSDEILNEVKQELEKGVPRGMSQLAFLKRTSVAFGPFARRSHALAMAPSELDEHGVDFFGSRWVVIEIPMIYKEFDEPIWTVKKVFVCSKKDARTETNGCDSHQRFPGSCSKCKVEGENLVPTVQVRDWAGRYE